MDSQNQEMDSQDHDMFFTNLLSQDDSLVGFDDSPLLIPNNPTSVNKCARVRGANFSLEEDKLLVSAWLNCSLDAIQGTDQKHSQLWERILAYFEQYKETTTKRTIKSLIHRWSCIQKATNKFCAKLAQVEGLNQSGMTEQDKFEKAKTMYQSLEKGNFQFEHCWHLLKDQAKWISHSTTPKQRRTMVPSPTTTPSPTRNVIENEVIELDRPMGRKAEKRKRKAQGKQAEEIIEIRKMKYTLLEESRAQEKEFYRLKAEKMEYDKTKEEKRLHFEDQRLRLEIEKMEYDKAKDEKRLHLEDEKLRLEAEKMEYDKTKEEKKLHREDERLRLEAEKLRIEDKKTDLAKRDSDERIMMMDVSVMPELQRLHIEKIRREIMMIDNHA